MTDLRIILIALLFGTITVNAQEKQNDRTVDLVSKGTFFTGLRSNFALGFTIPEGTVFLPKQLQPKIGYFIFDRFSVGLSYQGAGFGTKYAPRLKLFHSGEVDFNYYFYAKKNILAYSTTGIAFGNFHPTTHKVQNSKDLHLKLGAGLSFGMKKLPNLQFNVEATYYLSPAMRNDFQKVPNITFGVSYFLNRKKSSKTK